jgi:F-box/leucine-rich repeat protein 10/11
MARTTRRQGTKNEETSDPPMSRSISPDDPLQQEQAVQQRDETCPACVEGQSSALNAFEKERWIRCDACKVWYHWRCVGNGEEIDSIDKWCAASTSSLF